jgi:hypothetical protein
LGPPVRASPWPKRQSSQSTIDKQSSARYSIWTTEALRGGCPGARYLGMCSRGWQDHLWATGTDGTRGDFRGTPTICRARVLAGNFHYNTHPRNESAITKARTNSPARLTCADKSVKDLLGTLRWCTEQPRRHLGVHSAISFFWLGCLLGFSASKAWRTKSKEGRWGNE